MNGAEMHRENIIKMFKDEFVDISDKFKIFDLTAEEARHCKDDCVWHAGVYVWVHDKDGVLRIGRHLDNSRKRALEHIVQNTGEKMRAYGADNGTRLYLFNVINNDDKHWVAALEIYFELRLNPLLKAGRLG